jgi:hypothetical protein
LWQVGQRRLQPPVKSTQETLPGQSHRLTGTMPRTRSQTGLVSVMFARSGWTFLSEYPNTLHPRAEG